MKKIFNLDQCRSDIKTTIQALIEERGKILTLLLLFLVIYLPALHFPFFIFDDGFHVTSKEEVLHPTIQNFFSIWLTSKTPLIFNVWQTLSALFGIQSATPFRVVNYFTHLLNLILIASLIKMIIPRLIKVNKDESLAWPIFMGLLILVVHPAMIESVVWISSLRTTLSTTFGLLAMIAYMKGAIEKEETLKFVILSFILLILGILIKPTVSAVLVSFILFDVMLFGVSFQRSLAKNFVFIIFILVIWSFFAADEKGSNQIRMMAHQRVLVVFKGLFFYITHALLPNKILIVYPDSITSTFKEGGLKLIEVVITGLSFLAVSAMVIRKELSALLFTLILFTILISPHIGIVSFDYQGLSLYADRYLYFALIAVAILVVYLAIIAKRTLPIRYQKLLASGYFIVVLLLSLKSFSQIPLWKDSNILKASYDENPNHVDLAIAYATNLQSDKEYARALTMLEGLSTLVDTSHFLSIYSNLFQIFEQFQSMQQVADYRYFPKHFDVNFLISLERTNRLVAAESYLEKHRQTLGETQYKFERERLNKASTISLSEAHMIIGDSLLINPPSNFTIDQVELAALTAYKEGIKLRGSMTDAARLERVTSLLRKIESRSTNQTIAPKTGKKK